MSIRVPKYRLHKGSGQALVQINGEAYSQEEAAFPWQTTSGWANAIALAKRVRGSAPA